MKKIFRFRINRELKITVKRAPADGRLELLHKAGRFSDLNDTAQRLPLNKLKGHRVNNSEEPISADHMREKFTILRTAAPNELAVDSHQIDRKNVLNERPQSQTASVHVRAHRAAEREIVRAGLLLIERPERRRTA